MFLLIVVWIGTPIIPGLCILIVDCFVKFVNSAEEVSICILFLVLTVIKVISIIRNLDSKILSAIDSIDQLPNQVTTGIRMVRTSIEISILSSDQGIEDTLRIGIPDSHQVRSHSIIMGTVLHILQWNSLSSVSIRFISEVLLNLVQNWCDGGLDQIIVSISTVNGEIVASLEQRTIFIIARDDRGIGVIQIHDVKIGKVEASSGKRNVFAPVLSELVLGENVLVHLHELRARGKLLTVILDSLVQGGLGVSTGSEDPHFSIDSQLRVDWEGDDALW